MGKEAGCEGLLEVGDSCEGGYVWDVEVGETHFCSVVWLLVRCMHWLNGCHCCLRVDSR
jgi:hypothetical protein